VNPSKRVARILVPTLLAMLVYAGGCSKSKSNETTTASAPAPAPQSQAPAASPASQLNLDDLVAPIALYPDQLLGQILIASVNSQEVLDLGNWLIQNQSIKTDAAPAAAKQAGFSTSAQYLAAFPQVVDNMCQELDWTKQLGDAYKNNPQGVMDAVQRKRQQAQQVGNLQSSPQMAVDTTTANGKQVVEIKPADPQVVYVPQYNTQTVYTTPPAQTTTVVQQQSGVSTGAAVGIGLLSFGIGMAVGSAFHNDNYYPYPSWGYGGMYYGGRPYYPPPYRPPVYAGYRPVYGYHPPPNYHWNQYNRNVNVKVNNNNYYGQYRGGQNRGNTGYLGAANVNNRPNVNAANRSPTGYLGARPNTGNERPGASMARSNPAPNLAARNQPNAGRASLPNRGSADSRNLGAASRGAGSTSAATNRAANRPANAGGGDRGFAGGNAASNRTASQARVAQSGSGGGAFGGNNSGRSERAASNRGRASAGAGQRQLGNRPH
jgi:hypothetical protein